MLYPGQKQDDAGSSSKDVKEDKDNMLEPSLQADMDEFLDECFNEGTLVSLVASWIRLKIA